MDKYKLIAENITVSYNNIISVKNITMKFKANTVTSLIGPSGCGKTSFLRCLNRMHDMNKNVKVMGKVVIDNTDLYLDNMNPIYHRRKVGMVFQKPNPFPTMSIYDNVTAGLRLNGIKNKKILDGSVENSLKLAYLWDEVKSDLKKPAIELSGGQQQRLCIARALAINPEILLMDEPSSALDPISTQKIEETIMNLKNELTIIIVTHNMQQAIRISDYTAFMYLGKLIEFGETKKLFTAPTDPLTAKYVKGFFG
ncbi:MAG: phosphate ABC transporter ATP-binding protein [Nitrosopumilaceae archaeon]|nr:phosphate ABC transporter ATP-binding protein [Nitrosopumilaceae archaeon]